MIEQTSKIRVEKTERSRLPEVDFENLAFGKEHSDHMFMMEYENGSWQEPRIVPFQDLQLSPFTSALHYGQSIFEGMKAHLDPNDDIVFFRPYDNIERMNNSAERMCMPQLDPELFMEAMKQLAQLDKDWIPRKEGSALYIRPLLFGADEFLGVQAAESYRFYILTGPVAGYYSKPVDVKVETHYSRACEGGMGAAKTAGNYAGSLYPAALARKEGFDQLIWTDAKEHRYIEEAGTMNVMFLIDGKLITAPLSYDTILPGVTRKSVLTIAEEMGVPVEERRLSVEELVEAFDKGTLEDAFGTGTAATIAHIQSITHGDKTMKLKDPAEREVSNKIKEHLEAYKRGRVEDKHGWLVRA
jgi:branched-chain amino acid aminotransferase